jgi:hypothetical protein
VIEHLFDSLKNKIYLIKNKVSFDPNILFPWSVILYRSFLILSLIAVPCLECLTIRSKLISIESDVNWWLQFASSSSYVIFILPRRRTNKVFGRYCWFERCINCWIVWQASEPFVRSGFEDCSLNWVLPKKWCMSMTSVRAWHFDLSDAPLKLNHK